MRSILTTLVIAALPAVSFAVELPKLPEPVTSFGAVISGGSLYAYGGHKAGSHSWSLPTTSSKLQKLDLANPTEWEELKGGPAVQSPGIAAYDGKVYLVGGMQPQNDKGKPPVLKSLDYAGVYDPKTNTWTDLPKLPEARSSHDIAVLDGKLYAVAGWPLDTSKDTGAPDDRHKTRPFHKSTLVLDLAKPESGWQTVPQNFERRAIALVASGGKLYAIGGMTPDNAVSSRVDSFDPATNTWTQIADVPTEGRTKGFATAACDLRNEVIASPRGGKVFALRNGAWKEVGKLKESRFFHQLEAWKDQTVIALGGSAGEDPLDTVEVVTLEAPAAVSSN